MSSTDTLANPLDSFLQKSIERFVPLNIYCSIAPGVEDVLAWRSCSIQLPEICFTLSFIAHSTPPLTFPCTRIVWFFVTIVPCLLYTSDAADEEDSVDLGGRRL